MSGHCGVGLLLVKQNRQIGASSIDVTVDGVENDCGRVEAVASIDMVVSG